MNTTRLLKTVAVGGACAAIGAGASALASAGAAPSKPTAAHADKHHGKQGRRGRGVARVLRRAVHVSAVVAAPGTSSSFATVTLDRGTVTAVSSNRITLREGTAKHAYRTVTLTLPANAKVRDNRHGAKLADVKPGQKAIVVKAPKRTMVRAHDARHHRRANR